MAADSEVSRGRKTLLLHAQADDQLLGLHSQAHPQCQWPAYVAHLLSQVPSAMLRYIMAMVVVVGREGGGCTWQAGTQELKLMADLKQDSVKEWHCEVHRKAPH